MSCPTSKRARGWGRFTMEKIYRLLQTPESERERVDLSKLFFHLKDNNFFKNLVEKKPLDAVLNLVNKLTYEFKQEGEFVFRHGEKGTTFYVILDGIVGVNVPIVDDEETDLEKPEREVAQMIKGQSFGELALIYDQPRAASIQAKTDCHFAVLEKQSYAEILQKEGTQELESTIKILRQCPMFAKWTQQRINKMPYYFSAINVYRNQILYKEGDKVTFIYIVASGDFKLTKSLEGKRSADIAIVSNGEILGDGENSWMDNTCQWVSTTGSMLKIKAEDFYKRIQNQESWLQYKKDQSLKHNWRTDRFDSIKKFEKDEVSLIKKSNQFQRPKKFVIEKLQPRKGSNHFQQVKNYVLSSTHSPLLSPKFKSANASPLHTPKLAPIRVPRPKHRRNHSWQYQGQNNTFISYDNSGSWTQVNTPMLEEYRQRSNMRGFKELAIPEPINAFNMTLTNENILEVTEYTEDNITKRSNETSNEYTEDRTGRRYFETQATPFSMSGVSVKASPRYFLSPSQSFGAQAAALRPPTRPTKFEKEG